MLLVLECAPVEHDIARFPLERLLPIGLAGQGAVAALHVELALHDDEFLVNLARPPALWVHDDRDRKSTRLNSSHTVTTYAVFCLKKKTRTKSGYSHSFHSPA